jgi:phosphoglucosamine mutase
MGRLFGTDGVRGVANAEPLTPELAYRLGRAAAPYLAERAPDPRQQPAILVGRDTRRSGPLLEQALVAGVLSTGVDALVVGVLPTPGIAVLTRDLGAAGGVVLSASHNPFEDNGIKLFAAGGGKLPDEGEDEIEALLAGADRAPRPTGKAVGRLRPVARAEARYLATLRGVLPAGLDLRGMRLCLDCAHGATYRVAPRLFRALSAQVDALGVRPTGTNINQHVGALHPERLQARVRALGAAVGLAFDGDGDRLITVDETGEIRDGDHLLAILAHAFKARGTLRGGVVVSTVMANLGLERALAEAGVSMVRTPVGDRHVLTEMQRRGANLGGEQSGHLILLDHVMTGDGLVSALALLGVLRESGRLLSDLAACVIKCPQVLVNVPVGQKPPLGTLGVIGEVVGDWERRFAGRARILLRYSGTEPLLRVMVEGEDQMTIEHAAEEIAGVVRTHLGSPR